MFSGGRGGWGGGGEVFKELTERAPTTDERKPTARRFAICHLSFSIFELERLSAYLSGFVSATTQTVDRNACSCFRPVKQSSAEDNVRMGEGLAG